MTSIGVATLQIIPVLRGVSDAIRRETRNLRAEVEVDVPNADATGRRAGAGIRRGLRDSRIADGLHRQVDDELSDANAQSTGRRFGASMAAAMAVGARGMARGFGEVTVGAVNVVRHIGAIATGTQAASVATRTLARGLIGVGGGLALLGAGPLGKLGIGLSFASKLAGGLARDVGRVTSALVVMAGAARGVQVLNNMARIGRNIVVGFSAVLGVVSAVTSMVAGPLISAVVALGAAFGVAAGAAAGLLGPVAAVASLASSGIQNAVSAYTTQQKASGGGGGASAASQARAIESAEKAVVRAKRDAEDAEKDLTRARKDAVEQLEDMRLALAGAALSEKDAQLGLLEARRDLANLGSDGQSFDMLDRERAILRVQEAEQRLAETQESNGDLREEAADQEAKGVEGSDEVVAAKRRVEDANAAVIESQQALTDAINQTNAAGGGPQVDPFDAMIGARMAPAIEAVQGLRRTVTDNLTSALTPAFSTFAGLVDGLSPRFANLSTTLGGIGTSIMNNLASPENSAALDKMFGASDSFFQRFLSGTGVNGAISGLVQFASTAADTFSGVGGDIDGALGKLGDWLRNISPAQMQLTFESLRATLTGIGNVVGPIFSALRELAGISAPALAPGFAAFGQAIRDATPGIMAMARDLMPGLGQALANISPLLPTLVDAFRPWATILGVLAPVVASVVNFLGPMAPVILAVAAAAKVISAAFLLWNTAMFGASIAMGVFVAATGRSTAMLGTNTVALVAHRVAMIAGAAASGALSIATGALNAVMSANPIAIVVLAVAALIAGIVLAYKNSETFRNVVQAAWDGIKAAVGAAWQFIGTTVLPALQAGWQAIATGAMWLWNNAIKPAWEGIKVAFQAGWAAISFVFDVWKFGFEVAGAAASALWRNVIMPVWDGISAAFRAGWSVVSAIFDVWKGAWELVGAGAMVLWQNVIAPVWEGIKGAFQSAWDFIRPIFEKLGAGWESLSGKVTSVAKVMGDGIRGAFDGVVDIIKAPLHALGSFLVGIPGEVLGVAIPGIDTVHGWGTNLQGLSDGGYTGNVGVAQAAGIVHGDEFVIKATSRRKIENAMPGLLDFLNAQGQLPMPGYADGGLVAGTSELRKIITEKFGISNIGGYRPGGDGFNEHSTGRALDVMTTDRAKGDAVKDFAVNNASALDLKWAIWQQKLWFPGGGSRPMEDRGSPTDNHMDHVHIFSGPGISDGLRSKLQGGDGNKPGPGVIDPASSDRTGTATAPGVATAPDIARGSYSAPSVAPLTSSGGSGGGSSREIPSSLSGLAGMPFAGLNAQTTSPNGAVRKFEYGDAIASGVSGQVSSALGVLGINDSPPILQAASKILGGIKVGGKGLMDFGSAGSSGPLGGIGSDASGSVLPGSNPSHLQGGGPGPGNGGGTTWNIQTAKVEDAFMQAQQKEREAAAARLQRF